MSNEEELRRYASRHSPSYRVLGFSMRDRRRGGGLATLVHVSEIADDLAPGELGDVKSVSHTFSASRDGVCIRTVPPGCTGLSVGTMNGGDLKTSSG